MIQENKNYADNTVSESEKISETAGTLK